MAALDCLCLDRPRHSIIQLTRAQVLPVRVAVATMRLRAQLTDRREADRQDERPNVLRHPCP